MRKIQIYPNIVGAHTAYNSLIENPPKGYELIGNKQGLKTGLLNKSRESKVLRKIYHSFLKVFPTTKIIDSLRKEKEIPDADLIFSTGHLYNGEKAWILYILDSPFSLAGNNYKIFIKNKDKIGKNLEKENCKKIICAHETSLNFMKKEFSKRIKDKLILVRPAINLSKIKTKGGKRKKVRILFMGSVNNPRDFYVKGGLDVLRTFEKVQEKERDVELIIRCFIPEELRRSIAMNKNIKVIENLVSKKKLEELYSSSDILFLPSHQYILMAVLEAMNFSLPILGIDTYAVKDYVQNGKNGIIAKKSEKNKLYESREYPTNTKSEEFMRIIKEYDPNLIERLEKALLKLVKNKKLRERLGRNGKETIKKKFSIEIQREKLRRVFDESFR
ncbi:hypothetical protein CMI45_01295 [Candidatus Pacearchaeota archaeon]|nr:hypothetical protein [Candidatus Pacearchaeota archaeon]|tara:strand:- start:287 stop:1450 length:1164 start_codon:yes stop_codon:yes gene_type:complete